MKRETFNAKVAKLDRYALCSYVLECGLAEPLPSLDLEMEETYTQTDDELRALMLNITDEQLTDLDEEDDLQSWGFGGV